MAVLSLFSSAKSWIFGEPCKSGLTALETTSGPQAWVEQLCNTPFTTFDSVLNHSFPPTKTSFSSLGRNLPYPIKTENTRSDHPLSFELPTIPWTPGYRCLSFTNDLPPLTLPLSPVIPSHLLAPALNTPFTVLNFSLCSGSSP